MKPFKQQEAIRKMLYIALPVLLLVSCKNQGSNHDQSETKTLPVQDTLRFKSGYSDVNGLKMYYEIYGQGSPLVLIHGGGSTIQSTFGRVIPLLAKDRQIIAVELQAHGRTADMDRPESFQQDADDVAGLLKNLKIDSTDIFGFSNGGTTTMQIAIRHPELVRKIVLGSAIYKRDGMYSWFWESFGGVTLKDMPRQLKDAYLEVNPDTNGLHRMFLKDKTRMLEFKDWKDEDLRSIKAPALIIVADKDVVRPEHAVEMFRLIPNCELAIIPGIHGAYIGEITTLSSESSDSLLVVPLVEKFLSKPIEQKE